jgi:hypothetical protein
MDLLNHLDGYANPLIHPHHGAVHYLYILKHCTMQRYEPGHIAHFSAI